MNKEYTQVYKGILTICVFLGHFGNYEINYYDNFSFQFLTPLAYLAVSIFLFLSGYGLAYSIKKRGKQYLNGFLSKRVLPLYMEYLFFAVLYIVFQFVFWREEIQFSKLVKTIAIGDTYVANGWYVQCIMLIYLLFYLYNSLKISKNQYFVPIVIVGIYCILHMILHLNFIYIQSIFAFIVGYFYFLLQDNINQKLKNYRSFVIIVIFLMIGFVTLLGASYVVSGILMRRILRIAVCSLAPMVFVVGASHLNFTNTIMNVIGGLSLELYLLQGLFFSFWGHICKINNSLVYAIVVFGVTFLFAFVIQKAYKILGTINFRT